MRIDMMYKVLCCLLLLGGLAQANIVTILETDFDGAIPGAGSELTNVTWIADAAITASSTVTSVSGHELSNVSENGTVPSQWDDNVGVHWNLNLSRSTPRGITASFSVAGSAIQLNELSIGHTHTSNAGTLQAYASYMTVTLTNVTDAVVLFTNTINYDYSSKGWQVHAYDASSILLEDGKDYTITLTMQDMDGGGAYATWDGLTLTGESVYLDKAQLIGPAGNKVSQDAILEWGPPPLYPPTGYDLYFGTNASVYANPKVVDDQLVNSYDPPDLLDPGTTYYWVVDTHDGTGIVPGDVWSFTTGGAAVKMVEWKLENAYASGPDWMTADTSSLGNDGTFINGPAGGPIFVSGLVGNCLELTGDDDSVVREDATFLPLNETDLWGMNLYLYLNGKPDDWTRIANVGDDNYRQLFIYRNNEIAFLFQNKYLLLSGETLDLDRWTMLTVTYDGSYLRMFVDGVEVASKELPFTSGDELDSELNMLNYAHAGNFSGRIDEFTFWDDALSLVNLAQLAEALDDGSMTLDDLTILAANWLTDNSSMIPNLVLDDFQAYTGDTDPAFTAAWQTSVEGTSTLSLEGSQVMTWAYDLGTGRDAGLYHWPDTSVELSQYDQLRVRIYKNTGSTGGSLYCKFIELDADGTLWDIGEANYSGGLNAIPEDTWFEWVVDLDQLQTWDSSASSVPYDRIKDLDAIHIGTYSETGGSGSVIIDDLRLIRISPRCEESGFVSGDLNGNCRIDMVDLSILAGNWLN